MNEIELDIAIKGNLKEYRNITTPIEISNIVDKTLKNLPDKRKKKNRSKRSNNNLKRVSVAAALVFSFLAGGSMVSPTLAKTLENIPIIGSVFKTVGDIGLKSISEKGSTVNINKTESYANKDLSIKEISYDGTRISIGYTLENKDKKSHLNSRAWVGGKMIDFSTGNDNGEFIDENKYVGVINIYPLEKLPDEFNLDMHILETTGDLKDDKNKTVGEWNFKNIKVKKQKEQEFIVNIDKEVDGVKFNIDKITLTDATTQVLAREKYPMKKDTDRGLFLGLIQLVDDKGRILESLKINPKNDNEVVEAGCKYAEREFELNFEPIDRNTKFVTLQSWDAKYKEGPKKEITNKFPIIMDINKDSKIIVDNIEYLENIIRVYYSYEGELPYNSGEIYIENASGELLEYVDYRRVYSKEGYHFIKETKKGKENEKLYLLIDKVPTNVNKVFEINIPLK